MEGKEPIQGVKRVAEIEENDQDVPGLKRKKTVTWADGENPLEAIDSDDDLEGPQAAAANADGNPSNGNLDEHDTGAVTFLKEGADPLFAGLLGSALGEQESLPKSEADRLTHAEILARRQTLYDQLSENLEDQLWDVADELLLRWWHVRLDGKGGEGNQYPALTAAALEGGTKAAWAAFSHEENKVRDTFPTPSELERLACSIARPSNATEIETFRQRVISRRTAFIRRMDATGRLETAASMASARDLDRHGAVAALCGRSARVLLRRTAIVLGRGSAAGQGIVDVDLGDLGVDIEGKELSISRQQAQLFLDAEGDFKLRCLGRREMVVNGETLHKGEVATLPHLSLIRVGHVAVLFIVNKMALERLQKKSAGMSVY